MAGMDGQWYGRFQGDQNSGQIIVNLDDRGDHYSGTVEAHSDDKQMPNSFVRVKTIDKSDTALLHLDVMALHPKTGDPSPWSSVSSFFSKNIVFPRNLDANVHLKKDVLHLSWCTDVGTAGEADIPRSQAAEPSMLQPIAEIKNWSDFKIFVESIEYRKCIFRGQSKPYRLRTGFHRTGRSDLNRYMSEDIPALHRHVSYKTKHFFNLGMTQENGAFFSLAQHHGFPTPLLDWTYSPFVGAFFAYRAIRKSDALTASPAQKVRIFVFDYKQWKADWTQLLKVTGRPPHFSIAEFVSLENERLVPQQSIFSVTNMDDIEAYVRSKESAGRVYLRAIDLPVSERQAVMRELNMMGITAGSLFPGLDGVCEELRERHF